MSAIHDDVDLGHTVAGWTGCVVVLCGCATTGAGVCAASPLGVWLGIGVIALGGLVTWALHVAGWGKPSGPRPPEQWDWRTRDPMKGHGDCLACRLAGRLAGRAGRRDRAPAVMSGAPVAPDTLVAPPSSSRAPAPLPSPEEPLSPALAER
ncbi:HGxxPAAW family protein [Microbispora sp. ZYX-F-249]|uniref:HGxxPAAW family protein n=1 Tax=Microbispora maris TaxID=3144104 RepID=A0ABV0AUL7_9ACTN